ncbi:IS3 family transposase [Dellaglioa algida]|nr:IS3 family transposase [Dellaglioa algida]MDK1736641.1 IS3 family transposase [Dellaglioa algida]
MRSLRDKTGNTLKELLTKFKVKRSTYYDQCYRIDNHVDKYSVAKEMIKSIFDDSRETYGHRRIQIMLDKRNIHLSLTTILKLMNQIGIKNTIYCKHTDKYSSYKGHIGKIAPNIVNQKFNEVLPYHVLHTDVTQIKLQNNKWGYISAVTDEASHEVLALSMSEHPDKALIFDMLNQLKERSLPISLKPIIHSDQGCHYQWNDYQNELKTLNYVQSMSRKGNCLDNAPIESFFSLMKRECLKRQVIDNIEDLIRVTNEYVEWFNHERISCKLKGMTPIEYRNHALAS